MSIKELKDIITDLEQEPCSRALLFSGFWSLNSASLPFLDWQLFEFTLWNSGKFMKTEQKGSPGPGACVHCPPSVSNTGEEIKD